jgi:hypothetical protein
MYVYEYPLSRNKATAWLILSLLSALGDDYTQQ